jgi:predicted dehydrogenase
LAFEQQAMSVAKGQRSMVHGAGRILRFGVVGAGGFAEICHVPGLQAHPQAKVIALCGRNAVNCRAMADRLGVPDVHTDFHELVSRPDIDGVTIATPDVTHAPVALAALRAGKHVFCEKPLTMTVEQARELVAEAKRTGLTNMVSFTFRYTHALEQAKALIRSGAIGQPTYCSIEVHWPSVMNPAGGSEWRNYAADATAGILGDMGTHHFDTIHYLLSPIARLSAITAVLPRTSRDRATGEVRRTDAIDLVAMLFQTGEAAPTVPPFVQGNITASWMTPPRGHNGNVHISGTEGALSASMTRGAHETLELFRPGRGWDPVTLPEGAQGDKPLALSRMMGAFVDAILRGHPDPARDATFIDGLHTQLALDAAIRSANSKQWEDVGD